MSVKYSCKAALFFSICAVVPATVLATEYPDHCLPTNMKYWRTCPMPPQDVAARGDRAELRSWGLPERPDPHFHSPEYKAWFHSFFEMRRSVSTNLVVGIRHAPLPTLRSGKFSNAVTTLSNGNWSGWMLAAPPGQTGTLNSVKGSFTIPYDSIPGQTSDICPGIVVARVEHWVGIDGLNNVTGSQNVNVIQDGIDNYLACSGPGIVGSVAFTPWVEFYPRDPGIVNIPFSQGKVLAHDRITLQVDWAPLAGQSVPEAYLYISDARLNGMIALETPLNTSFNPNEAEVVNEAPGANIQGGYWLMPNFHTVIFDQAAANDSNGNIDWLGAPVVSAGTTLFDTYGLDFEVTGIDGGVSDSKSIKDVGSKYHYH